MLRRLTEIDGRQARYLACAPWHLLRARVELRRPVKAILDDLQAAGSARRRPDASFAPVTAGWALTAAARRVPWRSDCLVQAIAAARWLHRKGFAPQLHLGVARAAQHELKAHAWLTLDGVVIVGDLPGLEETFAPILELSPQQAERTSWR